MFFSQLKLSISACAFNLAAWFFAKVNVDLRTQKLKFSCKVQLSSGQNNVQVSLSTNTHQLVLLIEKPNTKDLLLQDNNTTAPTKSFTEDGY